MKSFRQFMEQPEIVNMMRGFAQQNKKSPKELRGMRDKIVSGVGKVTKGAFWDNDKAKMIDDTETDLSAYENANIGVADFDGDLDTDPIITGKNRFLANNNS